MLAFVKKTVKRIKWSSLTSEDPGHSQNSLFLIIFLGILEDALFWKQSWVSLCLILFINVIFFLCAHLEVKCVEFLLKMGIMVILTDAFEAWLRYKHRISFLKEMAATQDRAKLQNKINQISNWLKRQWMYFIYIRETNQTKAFLLANIVLGFMFLIGKYMSGFTLLYLVLMFALTFHLIAPRIHTFVKKLQLNAESDTELESLIPDVSDLDMKLLSFEPEVAVDDRQSLDLWKPDDMPIEDGSDESSDNSNSIVTNLSMERLQRIEKDIDTSDSSDEEYIPLMQQKDQLQSTMEVAQPTTTTMWGGTAFSMLRNISGAVSSMYSAPDTNNQSKSSSLDSTDGFEIIDKNELL